MKDDTEVGEFPPLVIALSPVPPQPDGDASVPWSTDMTLASLWRTVVHVTLNAEQLGATFHAQSFARAALFAFTVELLAVGSVTAVLALFVLMVFPKQLIASLSDPESLGVVLTVSSGVVLGLSSILVLLHWLWAWATELGAWNAGLPRRYRSGLALASYACGWDLITSPLGVMGLLFTRGPRSIGTTLVAAVQAPRRCALAYLQTARSFSSDQRKKVVTFAAWVTGPIVLALALALLLVMIATLM
jgi:hypothetical protein